MDLEQHIKQNHKDSLIERFDVSCQKALRKKSSGYYVDRIAPKKNLRGANARIGGTGKFYCGQHSETCSLGGCCDGVCGTANGCNCRACMLLDVEARSLPPGFLVNREGRACRVSAKQNVVFCGGASTVGFAGLRCGPNEGSQCDACKRMT